MSYGMAYGANQDKEKNNLVEKNKKARKDAAAKNKAKEDAIRAKQEIPQTKREVNKEARMKKQASRKVDRKYKPEDVKEGSAARKAAMDKERKGMDDRRERGRQFFVDMARAGIGSGDAKNPYEVRPRTSGSGKEFVKKFKEMTTSDPTAITVDNTARDVSTFDKSVKDAEALMQNTKIEAPGSSTASGLSNYLAGLNDNEFLNNKFLRYKAEDM